MISIREIDYDTDEDPEKIFSRITWAVTRVNVLEGELISTYTIDTNRLWIGEYNKERMNFRLIEPRSFFSPKFFQIVVRGQINKSENGKTIVNIKLRLGLHTFVTFLLMYSMTAMMIGMTIVHGKVNDIGGPALWLLVFPVLGTILLHRKLNSIETKIENLFEF